MTDTAAPQGDPAHPIAVGQCMYCCSAVVQARAIIAPNVICSSCNELLDTKQLLFAIDPPTATANVMSSIWLEDVQRLTGRSLEQLLSVLFGKMGFETEVTQETRDQGADLVLIQSGERIAVQAKRQVQDVGNAAVQALLGGMLFYDCRRGIVVTTSAFTASARQLAGKYPGLLLWGGARW